MSDIVTPIIHSNGDRTETRLANLEQAYTAVRAAIEALRQCAPNGRNYYPEAERMERAEAQHWARQEHLSTVLASLAAEADAIQRETRTHSLLPQGLRLGSLLTKRGELLCSRHPKRLPL